LSDFKLIKAEKDRCGIEQPHIEKYLQLPRFLVLSVRT